MPSISPAFPCFAASDPSTPGGLLLRHFTVTSPSAALPDESSLTLISTLLPLHDVNEAIKTEIVLSITTTRQACLLPAISPPQHLLIQTAARR
jgi:hypothetical protein